MDEKNALGPAMTNFYVQRSSTEAAEGLAKGMDRGIFDPTQLTSMLIKGRQISTADGMKNLFPMQNQMLSGIDSDPDRVLRLPRYAKNL